MVDRPGAQAFVPPDGDIASLRGAVHGCRGCELWAPATQAVFSAGPETAEMVLIGEQPGDVEDREGQPFVGPAGRVLREALADADIDPASVYVTNAVKHFRFVERGKRRLHKKPTVAHIRACEPWLDAEFAAVRPGLVVCLGATAARACLGREVAVGQVRGRVLDETPPVVVTAHPSSVLRLRGRDGWEQAYEALVTDLRAAASAL